MKTYEIVIFDFDENDEVFEYDRFFYETDIPGEMMNAASRKCQEIMKEFDLDSVYWNYVSGGNE